MDKDASEIACRLAARAHAVCRTYLPAGRRQGAYWLVGNIHNAKGRSLYVRLTPFPDGRGHAGKWTDAGTGQHGDLLDIIAARGCHATFAATLDEALRFLNLPLPTTSARPVSNAVRRGPTGSARRIWSMSRGIEGSLAADYLRARGLDRLGRAYSLRFHPNCYYRPEVDDAAATPLSFPALIAAVTGPDGTITGVHRTWLDPAGKRKAPVAAPRRAMGNLLGQAVRLGKAGDVMIAGEGIETLLSFRQVMANIPLMAGLSASHLAAIAFPAPLKRLYVARDNDPAGLTALETLRERGERSGVEIIGLEPLLDDFNSDFMAWGSSALARSIAKQLKDDDVTRFIAS